MSRYALLLAYDGTAFAGWWRQPGARTVAGELDTAFERLGEPLAAPVGASRTDAGVHARGQVAHVDCARPWTAADLQRAVARQLPPDLACLGVASVADAWHAVHESSGKTYRYRLDIGQLADPFLAPRIAWRRGFTVAMPVLHEAAALLSGEINLEAFSRRGERREDLRTHFKRVRWYDRGRYRVCQVRASRFGYRVVRSLVGGMVAAASGTATIEQWRAAVAGEVTPAAQQQAPACGLCLERVHYPVPPRWVVGEAGVLPVV